TPGSLDHASQGATGVVPIGAVEQMGTPGSPILQVQHSTNCNFDPYQTYHEGMVSHRHTGWRDKHITAYDHGGCGDPNCGGHDCGGKGKGCIFGDGPFGKVGDANCPDFECANCWARYDVEKRFIFAF